MLHPKLNLQTQFGDCFKHCNFTQTEKIQTRTTNYIITVKNKPYRDRLFHLNFPSTVKYGRYQGDDLSFQNYHNI